MIHVIQRSSLSANKDKAGDRSFNAPDPTEEVKNSTKAALGHPEFGNKASSFENPVVRVSGFDFPLKKFFAVHKSKLLGEVDFERLLIFEFFLKFTIKLFSKDIKENNCIYIQYQGDSIESPRIFQIKKLQFLSRSVASGHLKEFVFMKYQYDLFVIGAGSGGVRAARVSANLGAKVAIAEDTHMGGTCVNVGCIPKKLFVYGSHFGEDIHDAYSYGWDITKYNFNWNELIKNKNKEIQRLNGIYENLLDNSNVEIVKGTATIKSPHEIQVGKNLYTAANILIATGSQPSIPNIIGSNLAITSNEAFFLTNLPKRIVIVGGGYIAIEFAGIFNGLGVDTHLIYRNSLFLRGFDEGIRKFIEVEVEKKGIKLHLNTEVDKIEKSDSGKLVTLSSGNEITTDEVFFATGRAPRINGLNLPEIGVETGPKGEVLVDGSYRTSVENIYALGDVIDRFQLTPVAIAEAMVLAANLFSKEPPKTLDYTNIPTAIFSQPNIGTVGPTEEEARKIYPELQVFESEFRPLKYTMSGKDEKSMMKLLVNKQDDRVVAAHMVGPEAGEIIQGISVAIMAGATKATFDETIGIHPTAAEEFVTMRSVTR